MHTTFKKISNLVNYLYKDPKVITKTIISIMGLPVKLFMEKKLVMVIICTQEFHFYIILGQSGYNYSSSESARLK